MEQQVNHLADIPTEESVIAHLIHNPARLDEVRQMLDVDSFSSQPCRMLWKAIAWSEQQGRQVDLLYLQALFRDRSRTRDLDELNRIAASPTSANIKQQVEILELRRKRRVYHDLRAKLAEMEDGDGQELDRLVDKARDDANKHVASNLIDKYELMNIAAQNINENLNPDKQKVVMSGFRIIDEEGGLPPESEVIVAAFSSQGKTAFALTILDKAMRDGVRVALYSAEQGKLSIAGRFLNMMGWGVPITKFKTQALLDPTIADFNRLSQEFIDRPGNIFIDDTSTNSPDYICSGIRVLYRKFGVRLVMVDYLQIISLYDESSKSDQEKLAVASRKFQAVAKELSIVILVLSQFSRPSREQGHLPTEDLIRGSGQIYEACDIALYLYRPEKWENENYPFPFSDAEQQGTAMLKIGKYRDGESGKSAIVGFDGPRTLFYEFPDGQYDPDPKKNYPKASAAPPPDTNATIKLADDSLPF